MKKMIASILVLFLMLITGESYASFFHVGPEIQVNINIDNKTDFLWKRDLQITSYDQDVKIIYQKNSPLWYIRQGRLLVKIPENDSGIFYLQYYGEGYYPYLTQQCQFHVTADRNDNVTFTETPMPKSYITCSITGDKKYNNLVLHLNYNTNYFKAKHIH